MASTTWTEKRHSDRERWVCIYPAYLNNRKSLAEGRRLPKNKCVENPTYQEIRDVLDAAGFKVGVENKLYPREQNKDSVVYRGRIRVQLRNDDGSPFNTTYPTRDSLFIHVCEMIPKLKSRTQKQSVPEATVNPQNLSKKNKGKKGKR